MTSAKPCRKTNKWKTFRHGIQPFAGIFCGIIDMSYLYEFPVTIFAQQLY
jgi:hypothetical protein